MPTSLNAAKVGLSVSFDFSSTADLGVVSHKAEWNPTYVFTDGTGANQAKTVFTDIRTLAASASENLDLAGGLVDAFGNTITFTKVKAILVQADPANTNNVVIGNAASNGFVGPFGAGTHTLAIPPGGAAALIAPDVNGWTVTAGTGDLLKVLNSAGGTGVNYTITIIGV